MTHQPEPPPYLSLDVIWSHVFTHLHWFVSVFGTMTAVFSWQSGGGLITRMARVRVRLLEGLVRRIILAMAAALAGAAEPLRAKRARAPARKTRALRIETDDPLTWRARLCLNPLAHFEERAARQGGQPTWLAARDRASFAQVARRLEAIRRIIADSEAQARRLARDVPRDLYIFLPSRRKSRLVTDEDRFVVAQVQQHAQIALRAWMARVHPLDSS